MVTCPSLPRLRLGLAAGSAKAEERPPDARRNHQKSSCLGSTCMPRPGEDLLLVQSSFRDISPSHAGTPSGRGVPRDICWAPGRIVFQLHIDRREEDSSPCKIPLSDLPFLFSQNFGIVGIHILYCTLQRLLEFCKLELKNGL